MIPLPHDVAPNDIEQWCSRGVIMVRTEPDTWIPAWYRGTPRTRVIEYQRLDDGYIATCDRVDVAVHWPLCGSVNLPDLHYAAHAARQTQRQYRRTWHVAGLEVTVPRAWDVAKWSGARPGTMATPANSLARACFYPEYPTLDEAERRLNNGEKVSVALSPRVIMAGDRSGKRMFYYNGLLAATASDGQLHPIGDLAVVRRLSKVLEGRYNGTANMGF